MSVEIVAADRAMAGGVEVEHFAFTVESGRIGKVGALADLEKAYPNARRRSYGADVAVVPGFLNGHSHAYQILLRGWADDLPFSRWRSEALYKVVPALTPDDIAKTFTAAFREMLAAGITTVVEFFYLNGAGNAHAEAAIAAAQETGIRLVLARTWMDAPSAPAAFREDISTAAERTRELISRYSGVEICVAPHSVHAASAEMIAAAAEFGVDQDCPVHIHLAEAEYEVAQLREQHGTTPLRFLEGLGVLNQRLVAIHAIYLDDEEKRMLAASGASIVHNPMTNQYLGDGICDVVGLRALGVPVALGTDADVSPSLFDEMRSAALLQKIARKDGAAFDAHTAFALGTAEGARALHLDAGEFREGAYADYAVVDLAGVDAWSPLCNALVYRANAGWIRETVVNGRTVFRR